MPTNRFDRTSFSGQSARNEPDGPENHTPKGPEAFRQFQAQLEELDEYAKLYASAKRDALALLVRRAAFWSAAALVAASVAVTAVVTATVLAMLGLTQLLSEVLGNRAWAGNLILGGGLLLTLSLGLATMFVLLQSKFRKQTVQKYERRHQAQRARFGHDVREHRET